MKTLNEKETIFIIMFGLTLAVGIMENIKHYNKDNQKIFNIIDLEKTRNNIKKLLNLQKKIMLKYNYNYNFYKGKYKNDF